MGIKLKGIHKKRTFQHTSLPQSVDVLRCSEKAIFQNRKIGFFNSLYNAVFTGTVELDSAMFVV